MESTIPYRTLGRTGERVSAIGLGGWHLGLERVDEQLSFRIIRTAIDRGINFLDNCWDYSDGTSETRMGEALGDGYRREVFLMTKIDGHRTRKRRGSSTSRSSGCKPIASISCSITRSCGMTIHIESSTRKAPIVRSSMGRERARS